MKKNQKQKFIFDISFSLLALLFSPILFFFNRNIYSNVFKILFKNYTWIGYPFENKKLHKYSKFIFSLLTENKNNTDNELNELTIYNYTKNYTINKDLILVLKNIFISK